jgi:uncharacterized repeat protein (TIGR02543 family)
MYLRKKLTKRYIIDIVRGKASVKLARMIWRVQERKMIRRRIMTSLIRNGCIKVLRAVIVGIIAVFVIAMMVACEEPIANNESFTITFNSNGGSKVSPINVDYGDIIPKPEDPIKNGYDCIFAGWYDWTLTKEFTFNTAITADMILYAKWRPYELGETGPGGGKIFYRDEAGFIMTDNNQVCHYLEAAPADMDTKLTWREQGVNYLRTETNLGAGRNNTYLIMTTPDFYPEPILNIVISPAAQACYEYKKGGKNDWFLPSKDELEVLYLNKAYVNNFLSNYYWSSTGVETDGDILAYSQSLLTGSYGFFYTVHDSLCVRAIRAF